MNRFLQISESGQVAENGQALSDEVAQYVLEHLSFTPFYALTSLVPEGEDHEECLIESFDEPLIARGCYLDGHQILIEVPPDLDLGVDLSSLCLDEWDRFHGKTPTGIPFVLNAEAQEQFFDLLEEFSDEDITFQGQTYPTPAWLGPTSPPVQNSNYWSSRYQEQSAPWELNSPSPILLKALPGLKLPKSRVLILGCGTGEDAAEFARQGHLVTAVDFTQESLDLGKKKFPNLSIQWIQADALRLNESWLQAFDLIFEHTFYCAIHPRQRNELVDLWSKYLVPGGLFFGVFFTMEKRMGPPFGGSEWEIRRRLKDRYQILHWQRSRLSVPDRMGKELLVIAQKQWG